MNRHYLLRFALRLAYAVVPPMTPQVSVSYNGQEGAGRRELLARVFLNVSQLYHLVLKGTHSEL